MIKQQRVQFFYETRCTSWCLLCTKSGQCPVDHTWLIYSSLRSESHGWAVPTYFKWLCNDMHCNCKLCLSVKAAVTWNALLAHVWLFPSPLTCSKQSNVCCFYRGIFVAFQLLSKSACSSFMLPYKLLYFSTVYSFQDFDSIDWWIH